MHLTTAMYVTPKGRSIQAKGITPDIVVENLEITAAEKKEVLSIREKDLENHFETDKKDEKPSGKKEEKKPAFTMDEQIKGDYQILRALDLLKGWDILKKINKAG